MLLSQDALGERLRRVASSIGTTACSTIGPASRFSSTKCTVHPENFAPCSSAWRCDSSPGNDGQQRRVNIQNAIRKRRDEIGRKQPHVSGEANQIHFSSLAAPRPPAYRTPRVRVPSTESRTFRFRARAPFRFPARSSRLLNTMRDFGVGNAPRRNAIRQSFEIRAAPGKQHANAFFHDQRN